MLKNAEDAQQKNELWKLRRKVPEAVKLAGYSIEEDTVVPRAELPALIRGVKELGRKYDFKTVCFGHAGDGNLHIRIKKEAEVSFLFLVIYGASFSGNLKNKPFTVPQLKLLLLVFI